MCEHIESCRIKVLRVSGTMAQPYRTRLSAIAQIRDDIFNLPGKSESGVSLKSEMDSPLKIGKPRPEFFSNRLPQCND